MNHDMFFRSYFPGVIFLVLLLWGPIDHTWPIWLGIRIGYVILIPILVTLLINWLYNYLQLSDRVERIIQRIELALICVSLCVLGFLEATSETHIGNTKMIRTQDGMEAVGDDILLPGPDYHNAFVFFIFAFLVFWFGVLKKGKE